MGKSKGGKYARVAQKTCPQVAVYGAFSGSLGCFLVGGLSWLYGAVNGVFIDLYILGNKKAPLK